jgi:hypothetical protein
MEGLFIPDLPRLPKKLPVKVASWRGMAAAVPGYARSRCRHARSLILIDALLRIDSSELQLVLTCCLT